LEERLKKVNTAQQQRAAAPLLLVGAHPHTTTPYLPVGGFPFHFDRVVFRLLFAISLMP
jgi:hypothetical protein